MRNTSLKNLSNEEIKDQFINELNKKSSEVLERISKLDLQGAKSDDSTMLYFTVTGTTPLDSNQELSTPQLSTFDLAVASDGSCQS